MRNGTVTSVTLEAHLVVSYKIKHTLVIGSSKHARGMIQMN